MSAPRKRGRPPGSKNKPKPVPLPIKIIPERLTVMDTEGGEHDYHDYPRDNCTYGNCAFPSESFSGYLEALKEREIQTKAMFEKMHSEVYPVLIDLLSNPRERVVEKHVPFQVDRIIERPPPSWFG